MTGAPRAELLFSPADAVPISTDDATIKPWSDARESLAGASKYWLATGRPDGRPHVMPVLAVWLDDAMYISTRPGSRKGRNLAQNADCVITVSTETADLVVEGTAAKIGDPAELLRVADAFYGKYQWRMTVRDGHVYEDSLPGTTQYSLYRVVPTAGFGFGPDGLTATRWRF